MKSYDPKKIEKKWQNYWAKKKLYKAKDFSKKPKYYALIEFPYPSGEGLHVGHIRSNTAMDIIARKRRMEGHEVLYPIGWDAFGLPTENYAIKTGIQPAIITKKNTDTFRRQLKECGFSFDWDREINTTDPAYYKWTQWIFLEMWKKGLAYKNKIAVNWCPKDKVGLANEEVVDGKCERCGTPVEKREKDQWMLAITKYADRLDKDLDTVNFLEKIKTQQRNWIGRSEGAELEFKIKNSDKKITVFTTRADTLFGVTYVVLAPENKLVQELKGQIKNWADVETYIKKTEKEAEIERTSGEKEKTGVELKGIKAVNPANGEEVPVWIADYVLASYGTGSVMAVPAHDDRDFTFAKKYDLPIKQVIAPYFTESEGGKDAVRKDKKTVRRKTAYAFVLDKNTNKFLCLDWEKFGWHSGIIGGVDEGESYEDAARREIREETGYTNLKLIREIGGEQHNHFFAAHKDENRYAVGKGLLFELEDEHKEEVDPNETKNHKTVWKDADVMGSWLNLASFKYMWQVYESGTDCFVGDGILTGSKDFDEHKSEEARKEIADKFGKITVTYKLRDWVFSRQRYWGEPIPMVDCPTCGWVPVPEKELPLKLPKVKKYEPTDDGESPISKIEKWVNTKCPKCKGKAKRETDTMPNWAGSSWYYLRYTDPKNKKLPAEIKKLNYWTPVDWYNGGMEHVTLHLLYSRFWHKFLYDIGIVSNIEPYQKRTAHGMILGEGNEKMSKSKGNVVNPDEIVKNYGADTLRVYEMFMGPFDQSIAWDTKSIIGSRRFLEKVWKLQENITPHSPLKLRGDVPSEASDRGDIEIEENKLIKKVGEDIEAMRYNTAISSMMIFANKLESLSIVPTQSYEILLKLLAPFAPHIVEEIWASLGHKKSIHLEMWPSFDASKIVSESVTIVVQVNGKVRAEFEAMLGISAEDAEKIALSLPEVKKWTENKEVKKKIFVPNKLVNFVL